MIHALRYEVVRLRTLRSTWWLLGTSLVVSVGVAMIFSGVSVSHSYQGFLVWGLTALAGSVLPVQALLAGLVGAFAIGHEHRYGTIRLTLGVLPRRTPVLAAKALVVGVWSALVAAACLGAAWLTIRVWPSGRLIDDTSFSDDTLRRVVIGFVLLSVLWSLVGMALAGLLRNLPGAIVVLVVWPLLVEPILTVLTNISGLTWARPATKYFPFAAGQRLLYTPPPPNTQPPSTLPVLTPWEGGAVFAALAVVLLVAWWVAFTRADA